MTFLCHHHVFALHSLRQMEMTRSICSTETDGQTVNQRRAQKGRKGKIQESLRYEGKGQTALKPNNNFAPCSQNDWRHIPTPVDLEKLITLKSRNKNVIT